MAKTVKLKVVSGKLGAIQSHEREVEREGSAFSIQPHIIVERTTFHRLAWETINAGFSVVGGKRGGMLRIRLTKPIERAQIQKAIVESMMSIGASKAEAEASQANKEHNRLIELSMLTETSKMGCYSFNLPAGPTEQGGTCPASALGFPYMTPEQQAQKQRAMRPGLRIDERKFLCSGCYALKNNYGNPSNVLGMAVKYEITKRWLADGIFATQMVQFIRAAQLNSVQRRAALPREIHWTVPHPNYFRIHDAGDFYTPEYARAWMQIVEALPEVSFWAPTRMWAMAKQASTVMELGIPYNLALRPSALHFREAPPAVQNPGTRQASIAGTRIPGLSAASGSGNKPPAHSWSCPAMQPLEEGGGAGGIFPVLDKASKQVVPKRKKGVVVENSGTCARAHGPNSPFRGGFDPEDDPHHGGGCRACWRNRQLPIYYHEH